MVSVIFFVSTVIQSGRGGAESLMNPESSLICSSAVLAKCLVLVRQLFFFCSDRRQGWNRIGVAAEIPVVAYSSVYAWTGAQRLRCHRYDRVSAPDLPPELGSLSPFYSAAPTLCSLAVIELLLGLIFWLHALLHAGVVSLCCPGLFESCWTSFLLFKAFLRLLRGRVDRLLIQPYPQEPQHTPSFQKLIIPWV